MHPGAASKRMAPWASGCAALLLSVAVAAPAGRAPTGPAATAVPAEYAWRLPRGFPQPAVPPDNPMSEVKVALGERLFFEPRLSVTGRYSCASCHDPARAFSDGRKVAVGATGLTLPHNALALVNVAYNVSFGWATPGVRSLEAQMLEPLLNDHPVELGLAGQERELGARLAADPAYRAAFSQAFEREESSIPFDQVVKSIAAFERTLISGDSPFDRYMFSGDHSAIPAAAKRGLALFYSTRGGCGSCHSGFNFEGNWRDSRGETGRPSFANNGIAEQPMRVPTLRNIALTAPYMHDGRFPTLAVVVQHYVQLGVDLRAGRKLPGSDRAIARASRLKLQAITLAPQERSDLLAFLDTLTDQEFVRRYSSGATGGR
jgi:cytochrome c peroxidase